MNYKIRDGWHGTRLPNVSILWRDGCPMRVSVVLEPGHPMLDPRCVVDELLANGAALRDPAGWEDGEQPHELVSELTTVPARKLPHLKGTLR